MRITIGSKIFEATLYDNDTATALKEMLPLTLDMADLSNNEKYYQFQNTFPIKTVNVPKIENGDLMVYQNNFLVIFYKNFSPSYRYTILGKIDDPAGLQQSLGSGNVTIKFEL